MVEDGRIEGGHLKPQAQGKEGSMETPHVRDKAHLGGVTCDSEGALDGQGG